MSITTDRAATPAFELAPYKSLENSDLIARIRAVRVAMGRRLLILGHHYQQDEVIAQSDLRGDSYKLSQLAADNRECRAIVFCGVHFMAETADILANRPERLLQRDGERVTVVLPDMAAGCSLADMAEIDQVKAEATAAAKYPIPGLAATDEGIKADMPVEILVLDRDRGLSDYFGNLVQGDDRALGIAMKFIEESAFPIEDFG